MIDKVGPTSIKRNCFLLVATDYFIKWVEYKSYRDVNERDVICFIKEMIIHDLEFPDLLRSIKG